MVLVISICSQTCSLPFSIYALHSQPKEGGTGPWQVGGGERPGNSTFFLSQVTTPVVSPAPQQPLPLGSQLPRPACLDLPVSGLLQPLRSGTAMSCLPSPMCSGQVFCSEKKKTKSLFSDYIYCMTTVTENRNKIKLWEEKHELPEIPLTSNNHNQHISIFPSHVFLLYILVNCECFWKHLLDTISSFSEL